MDLHFEPVKSANRKEIEKLQVLPEQTDFIESVSDCMAEADEEKEWRPVGIYDGNLLIGFAMYGFFRSPQSAGEVWLDRILIDGEHQGKGYGKKAVAALLKRLHQEYNREQVYLSVYESNVVAIAMYQQIGFRFTGKYDTKGEKIMVHDAAARC